MIPYLNMQAKVVVGNVTFKNVEAIRIEESVKDLGDSSLITLPRNYRMLKGKPLLEYIKADDPVQIYIGYNGKLELEFEGFLKHPGSEAPLLLECDDQFYPLKQNSWTFSHSSITLKALLHNVLPGYTVECPELTLHKYQAYVASSFRILKDLQKDYGLFSRIVGKTVVVGFSFDWDFTKTKRHTIHRQKNMKESNLVWKRESDYAVRVEVNIGAAHGKGKIISFGDKGNGASVHRITKTNLSESDAKNVAQARYHKYVYNGFTGELTSFGLPRIHAGDSIEYQDSIEPEKQGAYLVEKVVIEYNEQVGWARRNTLAYKI